MNRNQVVFASTFALVLVSPALARASAPSDPPAAAPSSAPAAAPSSAPVPSFGSPSGPRCTLGDHAGIRDEDATTAAKIVCADLARSTARLPGVRAADAYRVEINPLGSKIVLTLVAEASASQPQDSRDIRLDGLEEITVTSSRLVEALLLHKEFTDTQRVDNITAAESRAAATKAGIVSFGFGLVGMTMVGGGFSVAPGFDLRLVYETPRLDAGLVLRVGGTAGSNADPGTSHSSVGLGGDYYLTDGDVSPYVGGGLAISSIGVHPNDAGGGLSSGLGVYGEAGVGILRLHHTHLGLGLRADVPFYAIPKDSYGGNPPPAGVGGTSRYVVPLSLATTFTF